ncbi:MAG TPA: hypothetical protein DEA08_23745, partial [Planctomycetes bacterium]|nr:hypothetical protein [Planctomycetota bacterium]
MRARQGRSPHAPNGPGLATSSGNPLLAGRVPALWADLSSRRASCLALPLASTQPVPRIRLVSKNNSSWAALGVGVMAVIAVAGWLLFAPAPTAPSGGRRGFVLPVTLAEVQRGDVHPVASLTGTVRAPRRARLGFEVPGVVSELLVREAEQVRAGQTLARLDSSDQDLSVAAREADVALAQRELAKAEAGPRPEEKRRLAAELRRAEAEADLARLEVERGKALLAREVFSQADLDRLVSTLAASEARVAAAKEQFAEARAGTRPEDLAIARAALARAEAALRIA